MNKATEQKKKNLSITLQELSKDVSAEMKAQAELKYGVGRSTINDYLKGNIGNIPTAEALVNFFRRKVISLSPDTANRA